MLITVNNCYFLLHKCPKDTIYGVLYHNPYVEKGGESVNYNPQSAQSRNMKINFPIILKDLMEQKKLNQLQLSDMLGIRQSQISNWLNGKSLPGYYSIKLLCDKLNVSADFLIET